MKEIAVVISDVHLNWWTKFNSNGLRTQAHFDVLRKAKARADFKNIPLLIPGDLFHTPKGLSNKLLNTILPDLIDLFKTGNTYAISGNHDMSEHNFNDQSPSPSYIKLLEKICDRFNCMDFRRVYHGNYKIYGIPYLTNNLYLQEALNNLKVSSKGYKNILMIHTDYPGAKDNDNREVGTAFGFSKKIMGKLAQFDIVLCGHIHKPQLLADNTYMVGAPLQMRLTDKGSTLGYSVIVDDGKALKLINMPVTGYPVFRTYTHDDQVTNKTDFWVKIPEEGSKVALSAATSSSGASNRILVKKYFRLNNIQDRQKRKVLLHLLNSAKNENFQ